MTGLQFLDQLQATDAPPPLVLISAHGDIPTAVGAMQAGAYSFVEKPFDPRRLISILIHAGEQHRLTMTTARLQNDLAALSGLDRVLLGQAPAIQSLRNMIFDLAPAKSSVLITGATGTGKELVARALHMLGPQRDLAFAAVNCATLTSETVETLLFGPNGHLAKAAGGTLFLDDLSAASPAIQAQLLRLFEAPQTRIIAAAAASPAETLRPDLFYRLNTFVLHLPRLSERGQDVVLLFDAFVAELSQTYEITPPELSSDDAAALLTHRWPGNIRELRHVAERRVLAARRGGGSVAEALLLADTDEVPDNLRSAVAGFERMLISKAIQTHNGRMDAVAEALGIGRRTLNEKIVKLGLDKASLLDP
jgi:DNA-binding NtrC family response regulator